MKRYACNLIFNKYERRTRVHTAVYSSSSCYFSFLHRDMIKQKQNEARGLFEFLLWAKIARVTTFTLAAIDGTWVKSSVASTKGNRGERR